MPAREAIAEGLLGRVETVVAWGLPNLINHGCHWYDVALALAGDPEVEWVSGQVDPLPNEPSDSRRRLDPAGTAQVQLANGVALYVSPAGRPGPAFEVLGDRGRLTLLNDARATSLWLAEGSPAALREAPFQLPAERRNLAHRPGRRARPGGGGTGRPDGRPATWTRPGGRR